MNAVGKYFETLLSQWGAAWNRFWFTPADATAVSLLRILTGGMACWFLLSFATDLTIWFGTDGLLPIDTVRLLTEDETEKWNRRASYLILSDDPRFLTTVHVVGVIVALAFTVGLATRITGISTLAIVLSYVHRGPMIMGQFEPVLTLMLFYLVLAPCHRRFSVDRWLSQRRQAGSTSAKPPFEDKPSITANVCQRMMQVHIAALYLMMGLTKLGGSDVWWSGEAMWWLIAHTESRLVDLTFLHRHEYLINLWTHAVVWFELLFGLLIWHRLARPLLLAIGVIQWISLGLVTGLLSYCVMMLIANLSFVSSETIRDLVASVGNRRSHEPLPASPL